MKKFLFGLMVGVFLVTGAYFIFWNDPRIHVEAARLLDQDLVYLKDDTVVRGWIINEDKDSIFIETTKGSYTLPRSMCKSIQQNVFLRYLRGLM